MDKQKGPGAIKRGHSTLNLGAIKRGHSTLNLTVNRSSVELYPFPASQQKKKRRRFRLNR